ncbi:hypothetical protein BJY52DRAFT_1417606 [Lactarius psammicola]|nr:hypothetical protein BJY52DRAFT_1417606 [Lactarius psammicola]
MDTRSPCPISLPSFAELFPSVGSPNVRLLSPPSGPSTGATLQIREIVRKRRKNVHAQGKRYRRATIISKLPDDVLLEIFDFCQKNHHTQDDDTLRIGRNVWKWHILVQVCRRWRQIIFGSPHRLNLRILCTYRTPVRKNLGIWPAFPIVIDYHYRQSKRGIQPDDEDNVVAALNSEHLDRVLLHFLDSSTAFYTILTFSLTC